MKKFLFIVLCLNNLTVSSTELEDFIDIQRNIPNENIAKMQRQSDVFGEIYEPTTGTLSFKQTDIVLPGNFDLEVAVRRVHQLSSGFTTTQDFGDWALDLPYITTQITRYPTISGHPYYSGSWGKGNECNGSLNVEFEYTDAGRYFGTDVYHGTYIYTPEQGSQLILENEQTGNLHTGSGMHISCFSRTENGEVRGQGFKVTAPDGKVYIFDELKLIRLESEHLKYQAYMMLSKVYDRFGNYVKYGYSESNRSRPFYSDRSVPTNLQQYLQYIEASDGRRIDFTYEDHGDEKRFYHTLKKRIKSITTNGQTWKYKYSNHEHDKHGLKSKLNYHTLHKVILPNLREWEFNDISPIGEKSRPNVVPPIIKPGSSTGKSEYCGFEPIDDFTGTIKSPSGSTTTYIFSHTIHGVESATRYSWGDPNDGVTRFDMLAAPFFSSNSCFKIWSLVNKSVNDLQSNKEYVWTYLYSQNRGSNGVEPDNFYSYQSPELPSLPPGISDGEKYNFKSTTVTNPDNSQLIYYVNRSVDSFEQDKVKAVEYKNADGTVVKRNYYDYEQGTRIGNSGLCSGANTDNDKLEFICNLEQKEHFIHLKEHSVSLYSGETETQYVKKLSEYDNYGHVGKIEESNNYSSKTKYTKYDYDYTGGFSDGNYVFWHRLKSLEVSDDDVDYSKGHEINFVDVEGSYPESANKYYLVKVPYQEKVFGVWQKKYSEYHSDGNVKKVEYNQSLYSDSSKNRYQTFTSYKRGTPKTIKQTKSIVSDEMPSGYTVNDSGWVTQSSDFNGNVVNYGYDGIGRLKYIDHADAKAADTLITWSYNGGNQFNQPVKTEQRCLLNSLKTECSGSGSGSGSVLFTTTTTYDGLLRPRLIETNDDSSIVYVRHDYSAYNELIFESFPSGTSIESKGTRYSYDSLGHIDSVSVTGSGMISYEYLAGNKIKVTDAENNETTTTYLAYGVPSYDQAIKIESPESVTTAIDIDVFGSIHSIRQYGGVDHTADQTEFRYYNVQKQLCAIKRNDVGSTVFNRNNLGQINWVAQGQNLTTNDECNTSVAPSERVTYKYDNLGAQYSVSYGDGTPTKIYTYGNNGNVTDIISTNYSHSYGYNSQNLLEDESLTVDGKTFTLDYEYNLIGHLDSLTYPGDLPKVEFEPNGFGQATQAIRTYLDSTPDDEFVKAGASYHANGMVHQFTYGNGILHTTTLNTRQLPWQMSDVGSKSTPVDLTYIYNNNNSNIESITNHREGGFYSLSNLTYDGLDRLTTTTGGLGIGSSTIEYDGLGNIREYNNTSSFDESELTYGYNGNNQLTSVTGEGADGYNFSRSDSYDERGNVTHNGKRSFDYNLANQMTNSGSNHYLYDGHNRRIKTTDSKGVSYSLYSQSGKLMYRETEQGGINHIFLGSKLVAEEGMGVAVANDSIMNYKPFGDSIEEPKDDVGYTGHKFDTDLGLSYMQARYYDPVIGRFYSNDPVGYIAGNPVMSFNRYMYVNNNPYKYNDPDGKLFNFALGAIGATVGAITGGVSSYMTSGGDWNKTMQGAGVGAGIGLFAGVTGGASLVGFGKAADMSFKASSASSALSIMGSSSLKMAATSGASNAAGQVVGGAEEVNMTQVAVSAAGGLIPGAGAGAILASTGTKTVNSVAGTALATVVGDTLNAGTQAIASEVAKDLEKR
jgi:RHS repeat-associated protein